MSFLEQRMVDVILRVVPSPPQGPLRQPEPVLPVFGAGGDQSGDPFQTVENLLIEGAAMAIGPFLEGLMQPGRNILQSECGHRETVMDAKWMSSHAGGSWWKGAGGRWKEI